MRKATKSPFCSNSLCETSLLLLTDKVRIPARLRILPETGLKVLHDIVRVPQRVAPVQLATPPLLRGARLVRHQRDRLGECTAQLRRGPELESGRLAEHNRLVEVVERIEPVELC